MDRLLYIILATLLAFGSNGYASGRAREESQTLDGLTALACDDEGYLLRSGHRLVAFPTDECGIFVGGLPRPVVWNPDETSFVPTTHLSITAGFEKSHQQKHLLSGGLPLTKYLTLPTQETVALKIYITKLSGVAAIRIYILNGFMENTDQRDGADKGVPYKVTKFFPKGEDEYYIWEGLPDQIDGDVAPDNRHSKFPDFYVKGSSKSNADGAGDEGDTTQTFYQILFNLKLTYRSTHLYYSIKSNGRPQRKTLAHYLVDGLDPARPEVFYEYTPRERTEGQFWSHLVAEYDHGGGRRPIGIVLDGDRTLGLAQIAALVASLNPERSGLTELFLSTHPHLRQYFQDLPRTDQQTGTT